MTNRINTSALRAAILGLALSLVAGAALADKPHHTERGQYRGGQDYRYQNKQNNQNHRYRNNQQRKHITGYRFQDNDRRAINQYYRDKKHRGKCPPGLTKKNQRCHYTGQHRTWHKGKPITRHTQYYDLPRGLRSRLSTPHENHRYVRAGDDVLLIDNVSNMVIDVIENILR